MHTATVEIDITRPIGRRLVRELEKYPKVAKVEYSLPEHLAGISKNPAVTGIPPKGYVTLEQFASETKSIINDYCDTYDIH